MGTLWVWYEAYFASASNLPVQTMVPLSNITSRLMEETLCGASYGSMIIANPCACRGLERISFRGFVVRYGAEGSAQEPVQRRHAVAQPDSHRFRFGAKRG